MPFTILAIPHLNMSCARVYGILTIHHLITVPDISLGEIVFI